MERCTHHRSEAIALLNARISTVPKQQLNGLLLLGAHGHHQRGRLHCPAALAAVSPSCSAELHARVTVLVCQTHVAANRDQLRGAVGVAFEAGVVEGGEASRWVHGVRIGAALDELAHD